MRTAITLAGADEESVTVDIHGRLSIVGDSSDINYICERRVDDLAGHDIDWTKSMIVMWFKASPDIVLKFDSTDSEWLPMVAVDEAIRRAQLSSASPEARHRHIGPVAQ